MRLKLVCLLSSFLCINIALANSTVSNWLDAEETPKSLYQDKALDITKDALLSVDFIENRANYFIFKLKNLTFGEYSENVLYIAPLVTGKFQFSMFKLDFYYDHFNNNKSGVKYTVSF